ncbi:hypothetical protein [Chlorobium sp. N1]|uniref:hypothetical protein n=1 Tax=Chlorobium sp. N1 TaxID=2491138 RepID=UPI00103A2012|nr:hypothetical protein [Chlorobium sp. N1]TCD48420.1 hypothetical protein E0L29_00570 [Chlorobium sp. N1]
MKANRTLRTLIAATLLLLPLLGGCQERPSSALDAEDVRFSEFYSDYLLASGISEENGGHFISDLDSTTLAAMLERHGLSMEKIREKNDLYRADPERWQQVLIRVRENIRKQAEAGRK